jgi:anthranilate/para-aminobenzoate synthase component I
MHVEELSHRAAEIVAASLSRRDGFVWLDGDRSHPRGRWSYLASDPVEVRVAHAADREPLSVLDGDVALEGGEFAHVPRFVGFVGFDARSGAAARLRLRHERPDGITAWLARYDAVIAFDASTGGAVVVGDDQGACRRLLGRLSGPRSVSARVGTPSVTSAAAHRRAIERAIEEIARGEIYQVNLARRWRASFEGEALALFLAMREASPVPFGAIVQPSEGRAVLSRSMETFFRFDRETRRLETRPIKGTIGSRGTNDHRILELTNDPKEHAEHAMIVDLMRNDVSRVAEVGSVRVEKRFELERYRGLAHLVSTIACEVRADAGVRDVMEALFPPGSVSGTPKLRSLQVIEDLEDGPRGAYCGAIGLVARNGSAEFSVAIRTAQIAGGEVVYHAGGGIVAASDPGREVAETELKARVFLDALASLERDREGADADSKTPRFVL